VQRSDQPDHGEATTLTGVLKAFEDDGYLGQFRAVDGGRVECLTCRSLSPAADIPAVALRRLEGASDPADMLAVVALLCPVCGTRGALVLNYGPESTPEDAAVLSDLEDARVGAGIGPTDAGLSR